MKFRMRRLFIYMMLEPFDVDHVPGDFVDYEVFDDAEGIGYWGRVVYDRPLTGNEVDHYNLDGPVTAWG